MHILQPIIAKLTLLSLHVRHADLPFTQVAEKPGKRTGNLMIRLSYLIRPRPLRVSHC